MRFGCGHFYDNLLKFHNKSEQLDKTYFAHGAQVVPVLVGVDVDVDVLDLG